MDNSGNDSAEGEDEKQIDEHEEESLEDDAITHLCTAVSVDNNSYSNLSREISLLSVV